MIKTITTAAATLLLIAEAAAAHGTTLPHAHGADLLSLAVGVAVVGVIGVVAFVSLSKARK